MSAPAFAADTADLHGPLRELFGFDAFLPGQEEIVRRALAGRDTLAVMPTGSGKSLPYQLAAMLRPSPTLVVSPLIALMKDQLDKLPANVAGRASLVNSSLSPDEAARRLQAFAAGRVCLLLASPERLRQRSFVSALAAARVGLVVVDEVHCVSMWGHDFRPDYLFIRAALAELGEPALLGLTATATPETEREIADSLGRTPDVVRASVVRSNLRHEVGEVEGEEERRRELLDRLRDLAGSTIVYARSRKKCEELSRLLGSHGIKAAHYHAGMGASERTAVQDAFLRDELRVVVATTAFGMGIDKPDIRQVLLYNLPSSLEDYVQMVGRAGRDGATSACVLFSGDRDAADLRRFARADVPTTGALRDVYRRLREHAGDDGIARLPADELAQESDPRVLVGMLERAGLVRRGFDTGRALQVELLPAPADAAERMAELLTRSERQSLARADRILAYAGSSRCRQVEIAEHFGELAATACGVCDRCAPPRKVGVVAFEEDVRGLPDDIGAAILEAASQLRWPLGQTGFAAMLAGSVSAPPSARRSPAFGLLAGARPATIKRWLGVLLASGHLERYESEDGFPLLRVTRRGDPPRLTAGEGAPPSAADSPLFQRLRAWRQQTAADAGVPAFVVFSDRTLHALAAARPSDEGALVAVPGIGPAKLARYGRDVLAVIAAET